MRRYCTWQVAVPGRTADQAGELERRLHRAWIAADRAHQKAIRDGHRCPLISGAECAMTDMANEAFGFWFDVHDDLHALRVHPDVGHALNPLPWTQRHPDPPQLPGCSPASGRIAAERTDALINVVKALATAGGRSDDS
jgi:hypothetical protein